MTDMDSERTVGEHVIFQYIVSFYWQKNGKTVKKSNRT